MLLSILHAQGSHHPPTRDPQAPSAKKNPTLGESIVERTACVRALRQKKQERSCDRCRRSKGQTGREVSEADGAGGEGGRRVRK